MATGSGETLKTKEAARVFKTLLEAPNAQSETKQVIVTDDPDCAQPGALDALANVTYSEATALLKSNERGVQRFFEEKNCPEIGRMLVDQGVSGHSLHMLSPMNIEQDLGPLSLGQQLAMKHLLTKLRFVAKTQQRRDEIWSADEYFEVVEHHYVEGSCWCPDWLKPFLVTNHQEKRIKLPAERYSLTEAVLRVVKSGWVDGNAEDKHRLKRSTPNFGCGCMCGYTEEPDPQYKVSTDNIDLGCVVDVDSFAFSAQTKRIQPSLVEACFGYEAKTIMQPAEVVVTYVERGTVEEEVKRKTLHLKVDPSTVEDVAQKIIAAKEEAQSADHGRGNDLFGTGYASPVSVRSGAGAASPARSAKSGAARR